MMMQAQEIMTREVVTIRGSATVAEAVQLMKEKSLRALIVDIRNQSDPFGIITETDIVYKVTAFGHDPHQIRVYELLTVRSFFTGSVYFFQSPLPVGA